MEKTMKWIEEKLESTPSQIENFLYIELQELVRFVDAIDLQALKEAAACILEAQLRRNNVQVTGIGKPGHVAGYIASLLSSTGTPAYKLDASEAVHGSAGQVRPGDVVIAISNSGNTKELIAAVKTLIENGAVIIGVTRDAHSWLGEHSDVCLQVRVEQEGDSLNKPPRASILAEIMMLQALSILLQNARSLSKEEYVRWHPGGAIGHSLKEENHGTV